jgi:hypothetical protein
MYYFYFYFWLIFNDSKFSLKMTLILLCKSQQWCWIECSRWWQVFLPMFYFIKNQQQKGALNLSLFFFDSSFILCVLQEYHHIDYDKYNEKIKCPFSFLFFPSIFTCAEFTITMEVPQNSLTKNKLWDLPLSCFPFHYF